MRRLGIPALCLVLLGVSLAGCRRIAFWRDGTVERVQLEVTRKGDDVLFTADDLFETIGCSVYDSERARRGASGVVRYIWRARCPHGDDCARSVIYGDGRLRSALRPFPLEPSRPGNCYLCSVSGYRRRGEVLFTIGADGAIAECPESTRRTD